MFKELITTIFNNVYYVVFDSVFLIIAILVVFMYRKENPKWELTGIKDVLRGTTLGIILSTIMSMCGISIQLTFGMMFLIPLTVLLTSFNPKWGCYAYVIPFTYAVTAIVEICGYNLPWLYLPYKEFIFLVGFLHLIEGILVMLYGSENTFEVPVYDGRTIITGHSMKKFWPVPLVIFTNGMTIIPLYAILGYIDIAKNYSPQVKSAKMGAIILIYGIFILILATLVNVGILTIGLALIIMPIGHELMFLINYMPATQMSRRNPSWRN
ncbi:MAG: hypothetical protein ATN34_02240 [Epulopiscium sp. Nele67-Bin002]|nr:MAG: hypothetical protein BEN18_04650 [Epulopiscium sp. Nuni2H_MBin001]OON92703.1 MAG: hypothetical protein ATN34_02240 [Epulopiscium sp. Nele67-Bin002]